MLLVKVILILLLGFILVSLFSGLYFLIKDKGQTRRTVNALSVRIGLSIVAIIVVLIAAATGVIEFNANPLSGRADRNGSIELPATGEPTERPGSGRRRLEPSE